MANDEARAAAQALIERCASQVSTNLPGELWNLQPTIEDALTRYAAKAVLREAEWWDNRPVLAAERTIQHAIEEQERIAALKEQAK